MIDVPSTFSSGLFYKIALASPGFRVLEKFTAEFPCGILVLFTRSAWTKSLMMLYPNLMLA